MAEWLKAADCKSALSGVRRFESFPFHQFFHTVIGAVSRPSGVQGRFLLKSALVTFWGVLALTVKTALPMWRSDTAPLWRLDAGGEQTSTSSVSRLEV